MYYQGTVLSQYDYSLSKNLTINSYVQKISSNVWSFNFATFHDKPMFGNRLHSFVRSDLPLSLSLNILLSFPSFIFFPSLSRVYPTTPNLTKTINFNRSALPFIVSLSFHPNFFNSNAIFSSITINQAPLRSLQTLLAVFGVKLSKVK